jgi:hypothetical protein
LDKVVICRPHQKSFVGRFIRHISFPLSIGAVLSESDFAMLKLNDLVRPLRKRFLKIISHAGHAPPSSL